LRSTFTFTQETADLRTSQWCLGDKPDDGIYLRGGATCEVTATADEIHEVIKGEEGFFKDVTSKLSDIKKSARTKVLSIVLFPITIPAFLLMTILGVIPYVLFMLIKGRTTSSFYRIINVAFYVLAGLVVIGEIAFASLFLI